MALVLLVLLIVSWVIGAYVLGWWMGHHRKPLMFWQPGKLPLKAPNPVVVEQGFVVTEEVVQSAEQRLANQSPVFKHLSPERQKAVVKRLAVEAQQLFARGPSRG